MVLLISLEYIAPFWNVDLYYISFVLFVTNKISSALCDTVNPRDLFYIYGGGGGPCACMSIHIWGCGGWCDIDSCSISKNMHVSIDRQRGRCWAGSHVNCPLVKDVDEALLLCGCSHFLSCFTLRIEEGDRHLKGKTCDNK